MAVSTAFDEFTEVLKCLEHSDVDVQNISLEEQNCDEKETLTASLRIAIPVLSELSVCDDVSVHANGSDLTEEKLSVDVTVSVPADGHKHISEADTESESAESGDRIRRSGRDVPLYKDPDALQQVYEKYDSFTEMTEALGVDVTSETVRRYMVEFDIHEPHDDPAAEIVSTDHSHDDTQSNGPPGGSGSEADVTTSTSAESRSQEATATTDGGVKVGTGDISESAGESITTGDPTGIPEPASDSRLATVRLVTACREAETDGNEISLPVDDLDLPRDITLGGFVEILDAARTPQEVTRELEIEYEDCQQLLDELNLNEFVTCRISATQANVTPRVICRRLGLDPEDV